MRRAIRGRVRARLVGRLVHVADAPSRVAPPTPMRAQEADAAGRRAAGGHAAPHRGRAVAPLPARLGARQLPARAARVDGAGRFCIVCDDPTSRRAWRSAASARAGATAWTMRWPGCARSPITPLPPLDAPPARPARRCCPRWSSGSRASTCDRRRLDRAVPRASARRRSRGRCCPSASCTACSRALPTWCSNTKAATGCSTTSRMRWAPGDAAYSQAAMAAGMAAAPLRHPGRASTCWPCTGCCEAAWATPTSPTRAAGRRHLPVPARDRQSGHARLLRAGARPRAAGRPGHACWTRMQHERSLMPISMACGARSAR